MKKKLVRSQNKIIAGACAGIAEYFDVDPTIVRLTYAVLSLLSGGLFGVIIYLIMMFIMPEDY